MNSKRQETKKIPWTFCAYGAGLSERDVLEAWNTAQEHKASFLYLQQADAKLLKEKGKPMGTIGIMAGMPFGGTRLESCLRLVDEAEALGCGALTFSFPAGMLFSRHFKELQRYLDTIVAHASGMFVSAVIPASTIQTMELQSAVIMSMEANCGGICLGTGTTLDTTDLPHAEHTAKILSNHGYTKNRMLEIGVAKSEVETKKPFIENAMGHGWMLRICDVKRTASQYGFQRSTEV